MNLRSRKASTVPTSLTDSDDADSSDSAVLSSQSDDDSDNTGDSPDEPIVRKKRSPKDVKLVSSTSFKKRGFTCPECSESFPRESQLRVHSRKHTGERRFVCTFDGCEFRTTLGAILRAHARQHTGEKPFKCKFAGCDYAAKQSGPLRAHERRHTGEKPYVCGIETCPQKFTQRPSLVQHIDRKHPDKSYKDAVGFQSSPTVSSEPGVDLLAGKDRNDRIRVKVPEEQLVSTKDAIAGRSILKIRAALHKLSKIKSGGQAALRCTFPDCDFSANESEVRRHFSQHIPKSHKRRCICDIAGCTTSYFTYRGLMKHHQETHAETEFVRDDLDKPKKMKLGQKSYLCGIDGCTRKYPRCHLITHVRSRHAGKGLEDTLIDASDDEEKAQEFCAGFLDKETLYCSGYGYLGCTFACHDKDEMEEHKRLIHYKGKKLYVCGIDGCAYRCGEPGRLRCHVTYRHPQADYEKDAVKREVAYLRPTRTTEKALPVATDSAVDGACASQKSLLPVEQQTVSATSTAAEKEDSQESRSSTASPTLLVVEDVDMDEVIVQSALDETISAGCEVKPVELNDQSRLEEGAHAGTEVTLSGMKVVGVGPCSVLSSTGEKQFGYFVTFGDSAGCTPVLLPAEQVAPLLRQEFHEHSMPGVYLKLE